MKAHDQGSSLFWLGISIYASIESLRLGIGTARNPGMGFMPFIVSLILGILSLVLFTKATFTQEQSSRSPFAGSFWKRVLFVIAVLAAYSSLMPIAGYLISTFFLMILLFYVIGKLRWWVIIASSFLATFGTYMIFSVLLNLQFPKGFF